MKRACVLCVNLVVGQYPIVLSSQVRASSVGLLQFTDCSVYFVQTAFRGKKYYGRNHAKSQLNYPRH